MKNNITHCIVLLSFVYSSLMMGMDHQIAFLITAGVEFFNHNMIKSLAVNKKYEKMLLDTADYRKKYMTNLLQKSCVQLSCKSVWHKYGTLYGDFCCPYIQDSHHLLHKLIITKHSLKINNELDTQLGHWDHFEEELEYVSGPAGLHIIDGEKLCLYGWGEEDPHLHKTDIQLKKYVLREAGEQKDYNCVLELQYGFLRTFLHFRPFPEFIEMFLKYPICEDLMTHTYRLKNMTYNEYKECAGFDVSPEKFQMKFKQWIAEQQNKK